MLGSWGNDHEFFHQMECKGGSLLGKNSDEGKGPLCHPTLGSLLGDGDRICFQYHRDLFEATGDVARQSRPLGFLWFPILGIYVGIWHWNLMDAGCRHYRSQQELKSLDELSAKP
jgi:hypothetical protein